MEQIVGTSSFGFLLLYEFIMLFCSRTPGALGIALRKALYPLLLRKTGKGAVFGAGVVLRHPKKIEVGESAVIDDGCVLDGRSELDASIKIGARVITARNTIIACKGGSIRIGENTGIGACCVIQTATGNDVSIGANCVIAPFSHIIGAAYYKTDRTDIPICEQGMDLRGGISIQDNVWLGSRVVILDGSKVGNDAIIGAASLVNKDIPSFSVAVGSPAKVISNRKQTPPDA